jgi:uncharacterized membrane protein
MNKQDKITLGTIDYGIIGAAFLLTLYSWLYVIIEYPSLSIEVPAHFNGKGEVDGYASKSILWYLASFLTAMNVGLFLLSKATSIHSIQLKTKLANFRTAAIFMPYLSAIQCVVLYAIIESAKGVFLYSNWMLPIILGLTAITLIIMFIIIFKNKRS